MRMPSDFQIAMYLMGCACLLGMAAVCAYIILETVRPNLARIRAALRGEIIPSQAASVAPPPPTPSTKHDAFEAGAAPTADAR